MNVKAKKSVQLKIGHGAAKCGNSGCKKCFGVNFTPFLNSKGKPEGMPCWMWKRWKAVA